MNPTDQLSYILPTVSALVDRVAPDQLHNDTPCADFDLHGVFDHMMTLGGSFAYAFRGEEIPEIAAPAVHGYVPSEQFRATMDDLLEAVKSPGALERTVETPLGPMPGETFARLVALDALVHGYDIATAAGVPYALPDCVVEAVDGFARVALTDDLRDGDMFKEATTAPVGASGIEEIAAFSGRSV